MLSACGNAVSCREAVRAGLVYLFGSVLLLTAMGMPTLTSILSLYGFCNFFHYLVVITKLTKSIAVLPKF